MKDLDLADPVHVALLLLVALLAAAILLVTLTDVDAEAVTVGLIAAVLGACLVVGTSRKG